MDVIQRLSGRVVRGCRPHGSGEKSLQLQPLDLFLLFAAPTAHAQSAWRVARAPPKERGNQHVHDHQRPRQDGPQGCDVEVSKERTTESGQ